MAPQRDPNGGVVTRRHGSTAGGWIEWVDAFDSHPVRAASVLGRLDVRGLFALGPFGDFERNALPLMERLETVHLDRREVREQILTAIIGRDEAEAL